VKASPFLGLYPSFFLLFVPHVLALTFPRSSTSASDFPLQLSTRRHPPHLIFPQKSLGSPVSSFHQPIRRGRVAPPRDQSARFSSGTRGGRHPRFRITAAKPAIQTRFSHAPLKFLATRKVTLPSLFQKCCSIGFPFSLMAALFVLMSLPSRTPYFFRALQRIFFEVCTIVGSLGFPLMAYGSMTFVIFFFPQPVPLTWNKLPFSLSFVAGSPF